MSGKISFTLMVVYHILPYVRHLWKLTKENIIIVAVSLIIVSLFYYQYFSSVLGRANSITINLVSIKSMFSVSLILHFINRFLLSKKEIFFLLTDNNQDNMYFMVTVLSKSLKNLGGVFLFTISALPYVVVLYKGDSLGIILYIINDYALYFTIYLLSVLIFIYTLKLLSILFFTCLLAISFFNSTTAGHDQTEMMGLTFLFILSIILLYIILVKTDKTILHNYFTRALEKHKREPLKIMRKSGISIKVYFHTFLLTLNSALSLLLSVGIIVYFYYFIYFDHQGINRESMKLILLMFPSIFSIIFNTLFMENFNRINFRILRTTPVSFSSVSLLFLKPHILLLFTLSLIIFIPGIYMVPLVLLYVVFSCFTFSLLSWLFIFNRLNQKNIASLFYFVVSIAGTILSITMPVLSILFFSMAAVLLYNRASLNFEYMVMEEGLFL